MIRVRCEKPDVHQKEATLPIDLRSLQKRGAEIEVTFYDMTSIVEYDPTRFTPGFRAEYQRKERDLIAEREALQAKAKEEDGENVSLLDIYRPNATLLPLLIKSWDIVAIDGKTLAIEPDAILQNLPSTLVFHIISEIWSDVNQGGNAKTRDLTLISSQTAD